MKNEGTGPVGCQAEETTIPLWARTNMVWLRGCGYGRPPWWVLHSETILHYTSASGRGRCEEISVTLCERSKL